MVTIPRSTILMCLIVSVPFGLAIRETLGHSSRVTPEPVVIQDLHDVQLPVVVEQPQDLALEQPPAPTPQETAAAEEAARVRHDKLAKLIPRLYGARPATLGSLLAGVRIGAPVGAYLPDATRRALAEVTDETGLTVEFEADAIRLDAATISPNDIDCETLSGALTKAWGASGDGVWLDRATHVRAYLEPGACSLRFDRYVDVAGWVGPGNDAVVPLGLIGSQIDALTARLGAVATKDADVLTWTAPGVGLGHDKTSLTVTSDEGKITQLVATGDADAVTRGAILDRLTRLLGPPTSAYTGDVTWDATDARPHVVLTMESEFTLTIGAE